MKFTKILKLSAIAMTTALLACVITSCSGDEGVAPDPGYLESVASSDIWTNTADTSVPEYQIYNHVHNFLDPCRIENGSAVDENGKTRKVDGVCLIVNADNEQEAQQELMDKFKKACNKLAELEDKLENGVLIELPCRVGDRIYRPVVDYISEETVMMITQRIYKNELVVTLHTEYSAYDLKEMGDLYFLTKSEAEQKLKELKK